MIVNDIFKKSAGGFFVMIGLIVLGLLLPNFAKENHSYDRVVSVKGLSEREVDANKVTWPIKFTVAGDDLDVLYRDIKTKQNVIIRFLLDGGLTSSEITTALPSIDDANSATWSQNRAHRYVANCQVLACSKKVDEVLDLFNNMDKLLEKGIILETGWGSQPSFSFEGLTDIKPEMIEEATKDARRAGEKFASDSGSKLGKIKSATQGTFSIEDRDENTPQIKRIRIVTYVDYYLSE